MRKLNYLTLLLLPFLVALSGCESSPPVDEGENHPSPSEPNDVEPDDATESSDTADEDVGPRERPEGAEDHSTDQHDLWIAEVAGPFEHPWSVAFLPDGRKLVTERPGRLFSVDDGELTEIDGLPSLRADSQGGLLDVSVGPDFEEDGWIYLTYSKPDPNSQQTATAVARAKLEGASLTDLEELFVQNRYSGSGRHYGSRIVWLDDGTFLVSVGDRGSEPPRAQDTDDHAGSVLRLNADGTVPEDNPFVGDDEVLDEIYTYGNRNIQGMARDPETGDVWAADHGPQGGDILYSIEAGNNHGWPIFTYGMDYQTGQPMDVTETQDPDELPDVVAPTHQFDPSHPPSGLAIIRGGFFDNWQGNILSGGLRTQEIRRLVVGDDSVEEEAIMSGVLGRIRDVRQGPGGEVYVLPDRPDAMLYRVEAAE